MENRQKRCSIYIYIHTYSEQLVGPKKLISNYVSSVGNGTLTIRDVKMDSNGRYRCTAGNKAGESSKEFIVCKYC